MNCLPHDPHRQFGLLVLAHGTRSDAGFRETMETSQAVTQALPEVPTATCFLAKRDPSIDMAMERLTGHDVSDIIVVPLFLFAARHVRNDIPTLLTQSLKRVVPRRPGLRLHLQPPLGHYREVTELSIQRCQAAIGQLKCRADETLLLLVGRGSHDPRATAEFRSFAAIRTTLPVGNTNVGRVIPALLAGEELPLPAAVAEAHKAPFRWVIVQPHLLFQGQLLKRLEKLVQQQDFANRRQQWLLVDHLGRNSALARVVVRQFTAAKTEAIRLS